MVAEESSMALEEAAGIHDHGVCARRGGVPAALAALALACVGLSWVSLRGAESS